MDFRYKITLYPLYIIIPGLLILSYLINYGYLPNIQIFFVEHVVDIGTFAFVIELVGFLLLILGKNRIYFILCLIRESEVDRNQMLKIL